MTGRGNWLVFLLFAATAHGQTLTFPTSGQFHPGEPMPVTIEAAGPGLIEIRGDGVQGIDWPAGGRGSATVPLTLWRGGGELTLTVNGKPQTITLVPLAPSDDPAAQVLSRVADEDSLTAWTPNRPLAERRWLMLAAIAGTLAIGATLSFKNRRGTCVALLISATTCIAIKTLAPSPAVRREAKVRSEPGFIEIDYAATHAATIREPFGDGLWFIPQSSTDAATFHPTLECGEDGKPLSIRVDLPTDGRARLIRRVANR